MLKIRLIKLYLEFVNDYLTIAKIAEDYGIPEKDMENLLDAGNRLHHENVAFYKETGNLLYPID